MKNLVLFTFLAFNLSAVAFSYCGPGNKDYDKGYDCGMDVGLQEDLGLCRLVVMSYYYAFSNSCLYTGYKEGEIEGRREYARKQARKQRGGFSLPFN